MKREIITSVEQAEKELALYRSVTAKKVKEAIMLELLNSGCEVARRANVCLRLVGSELVGNFDVVYFSDIIAGGNACKREVDNTYNAIRRQCERIATLIEELRKVTTTEA